MIYGKTNNFKKNYNFDPVAYIQAKDMSEKELKEMISTI